MKSWIKSWKLGSIAKTEYFPEGLLYEAEEALTCIQDDWHSDKPGIRIWNNYIPLKYTIPVWKYDEPV
jgi:hypothetical protein